MRGKVRFTGRIGDEKRYNSAFYRLGALRGQRIAAFGLIQGMWTFLERDRRLPRRGPGGGSDFPEAVPESAGGRSVASGRDHGGRAGARATGR